MSEISFDIEDYDLLEAFQEVEGFSSLAPQGIELKELTGDEAPSDEEPSDSEPEEQSEKVKTTDASDFAALWPAKQHCNTPHHTTDRPDHPGPSNTRRVPPTLRGPTSKLLLLLVGF